MFEDSVALYDFELPTDLIARVPLERRDASRLLVLNRASGAVDHRQFRELPELLNPGDLIVVNETQVVPARLQGVRTQTGGRWEGLFLREEPNGLWRIIGHTRGKLLPGETITLRSHVSSVQAYPLQLISRADGGEWLARPPVGTDTFEFLQHVGAIPLPPYMEREAQAADSLRYQTTFARIPGAVAAPTAGLHFTTDLFERLALRGIQTAKVTLHVGLGTFRPVTAERLSDHTMHSEWCELPQATVDQIIATRSRGNRVIAIGTTTVRTLESVARSGPLRAWSGATDIFIQPPYDFQVVDQLITNFHLPKSTLLVLVSAFADREQILRAYEQAIAERYRFYSYGDAMFIQ